MINMSPTPSNPFQTLDALPSRWQSHKHHSSTPQRLAMRALEVIALAGAMFIVPTGIHRIVQSLDDVYELLGRRARSPYVAAYSWMSVLVAVILLTGWHVWLGRLSYKAIDLDESTKGRGRRGSWWGRVLGRIVLPLLLLSFGVHFAYQLCARLARPAPYVTGNINDRVEIERE